MLRRRCLAEIRRSQSYETDSCSAVDAKLTFSANKWTIFSDFQQVILYIANYDVIGNAICNRLCLFPWFRRSFLPLSVRLSDHCVHRLYTSPIDSA